MASIIATSINLNAIPKDKIIIGKKGKYLPITITLNDELDQFGNQGPVSVQQSKEERDAKTAKTYLGNVKSSLDERHKRCRCTKRRSTSTSCTSCGAGR